MKSDVEERDGATLVSPASRFIQSIQRYPNVRSMDEQEALMKEAYGRLRCGLQFL